MGPRHPSWKTASLEPSPLENSFSCSFDLPFRREDVFKELADVNQPLGMKRANVELLFREQWNSPTVVSKLAVGSIREARFLNDGTTATSELVALVEGQLITWLELDSTLRQLRMIGSGSSQPTFSIALADSESGCTVSIRYAFHRVATPHPLCGTTISTAFPEQVASRMPTRLRDSWTAGMLDRGYLYLPQAPIPPSRPSNGRELGA